MIGLALVTLALLQEAPFEALPVFLWRQDQQAGRPPEAWTQALGGVRLHVEEQVDWQGVDLERTYRGQTAGRAVLHPERSPGNEAPLEHRLEVLTDPDFRGSLEEVISERLEALGGAYGFGLALGDEPGLTPFGDPLDQAWSKELANRLGHLPAGTPKALSATLAPGPWLATRARERQVFTETLEWLDATARLHAPGAPIGLLGLGDESAYRGVDLSRVARTFDFVETYPGGLGTAQIRTPAALGQAGPRLWRTVFATRADPADLAHQVTAHVLDGAEALVLWSDRALVDHPERVQALQASVDQARRWRAEYPAFPNAPSGVGILRDFDSIAACFHSLARAEGGDWQALRGGWQRNHGPRELAEEGLRFLLEDLGHTPGVFGAEGATLAASKAFPVWIAVHHRVLSGSEETGLRRHVEAGGWLWLLGPCFVQRPNGKPIRTSLEAELRTLGPGRVQRLDLAPAVYLEQRFHGRSPRAARMRLELSRRLASTPVDPPPFELRAGGAGAPFLRRWTTGASGELFCIASEHRAVSGETALPPLASRTVRVQTEPGMEITWRSGEPGDSSFERQLAPGEPAVFVLDQIPTQSTSHSVTKGLLDEEE